MSVRIIALAAVVERLGIFQPVLNSWALVQFVPHTGSRTTPRKAFSCYACTCHEGRASLFLSLSLSLFRIRCELRKIYANQDTPA